MQLDAMNSTDSAQSDRHLIDAALAGEYMAWDRLYHVCHGPLTVAIRSMLKEKASDTDVVDELAARVWYSVVRDDGSLLARFDPSRGCRLTTFLTLIAKDHASRMLRSDRRRRRRETIRCADFVPTGNSTVEASPNVALTLVEFERTLTPMEKEFFREIVTSGDRDDVGEAAGGRRRTAANQRQLGRRVRCKLERFLNS